MTRPEPADGSYTAADVTSSAPNRVLRDNNLKTNHDNSHLSIAPASSSQQPWQDSPPPPPPQQTKKKKKTHPRHLKVTQDTPPLATEYASVPYLRRVRVAVHLAQLELRFGADAWRERRVADDVAEGLPKSQREKALAKVSSIICPRPSALVGDELSLSLSLFLFSQHTSPPRAARTPSAWCGRG